MKPTPHDIARGLVSLSREIPADHLADACDAALRLLVSSGRSASIRSFPRLVRRIALQTGNAVEATIVSPGGKLGASGTALIAQLGEALGKTIEAREAADPRLLGGVRVRAGDDLLDASLRGTLDDLAAALSLANPSLSLP